MLMEISAPHSNMIACARLDLNSLKNYVTRNVFKRGNVELYDPVANPIATIDLSMKICVKQSAVQQIQTQTDIQKQIDRSQEESKTNLEQNTITHQQTQQIAPQQQPQSIKKEQQVSHQQIDKVIQVDQQQVHQELSMKEKKIKELENQIKVQKEQYDQLLRKQRSNVQQQKPSFYKFDYQPPPLFFKNEQEQYDYPKTVQKQKQQKQQKQTTQVQSPIVVEQQEVNNLQPLQFTENNILDKLIQELLEIKVKQEQNIQQIIYQKPSEQKISKHGRIHHVKDQKIIKRQQESEVSYSQDFEKDSVEFRRSNEVATPQPPSQYSSDFESVTLSREKLKCPLCNEALTSSQIQKHICSKIQEAPQAFSQYSSDFESMTLSRDKLKCPLCNEPIMQSQIQQHVCSKIQEEEEIESVSESIYSSV